MSIFFTIIICITLLNMFKLWHILCRNEKKDIFLHKIYCMRFFLKFKWVFLFIGFRLMGGKGALFGFLLGSFIDSLISPPTIRFRYYSNQRQWGSGPFDSYTYVDTKLNDAYRTLGVSDTATDDEVRQAYKRMALKYHPDRNSSQGEEARLNAERTFQQINQAKDIIFKARGLK